MHTFKKSKKVIKHIRSNKPYEKLKVDLVELTEELSMKNIIKYPLT